MFNQNICLAIIGCYIFGINFLFYFFLFTLQCSFSLLFPFSLCSFPSITMNPGILIYSVCYDHFQLLVFFDAQIFPHVASGSLYKLVPVFMRHDSIISLFYVIFFFFFFFGLHLQHMEVPQLGVELELPLLAYATAIAMLNLSCVCNLGCSLQQRRILNPLSKARD